MTMKAKSKISAYILRSSAAALLFSCVIVAVSSAINLPNHPPKFPTPPNNTAFGLNGHESVSSVAASAITTDRVLTFADRVVYQRAIEEVYWRHRTWPKANSSPKPPLDRVMSQAQIEKKVEDYLRNSQALVDYWQRPITAEQLQAEMERMAQHTKQPEVLRELFEALGNDPFVIAECLARPVLAERLLTNWYAYDETIHGEMKQRAEAELQAHNSVQQMKQLSGTYSKIAFIKGDSGDISQQRDASSVKLNSREWNEAVQKLAATFGRAGRYVINGTDRLPGRPPLPARSAYATADYETVPIGQLSALQEDERRYYATAVIERTSDQLKVATVSWLKEPLNSWLEGVENEVPNLMAVPSGNYQLPAISGGAGECVDDSWTATPGPPFARIYHTVVWTGSEMIVWGGDSGIALDTGERYNPSTDSWTAISIVNAPAARAFHTAVWTGSEMIIWGGATGWNSLNTGGKYNPSTDSWTATSTSNAPEGRAYHTAVWTGSEMIIWGGYNFPLGYFNTGGKYNPSTDSWTATTISNAPSGRRYHTAVWTGSEMIVWGGNNLSAYENTGGRYNPSTDNWTATSTTNAPDGRALHTAVWTGSEMIAWGGTNASVDFNTGGRYNPTTDSWTATSTNNAPDGREFHTVVWTGSEMIVWGGYLFDGGPHLLNTGGRYSPSTDSWTATSTTGAPAARENHTAVWTGSEMIVWGGIGDVGPLNTGGRYNPSTDSWTPTSISNTPEGRDYHTAVWTGSEMIVWGGSSPPVGPLNTGGRYNPTTDSWTATSITNAPSARGGHTAIWAGIEMIVWGGGSGGVVVNTGGRYNPGTDSWTATGTTNAPTPRYLHTAVWSDSQMIVWAGIDVTSATVNTGGRYDPGADNWTATSTTNAPTGRESHTAVWTGSEMIVWGGISDLGFLNTGGRYNPGTDGWTATSTFFAPSRRYSHTAVWTDSQMIIWGGCTASLPCHPLNAGGRYNPSTDSWTATSIANAPEARGYHTAVWTGSEMIVWGGSTDIFALNTGGRYNPTTDSWTATSTTGAPLARQNHTAVWSGSEMIIWGGSGSNTGGRYCAQSGPTATPTPTASATATATPTATPTPTPRPAPTPRPRPTPPPRPLS
jgi:N-acetylneuraminic acid mutarotase